MIRLEEKAGILRKIKRIAEEGGEFDFTVCILKHMGAHHNEDWEECLAELAQEGYLERVSCKYKKQKNSYSFKVGDKVRVKEGVVCPRYGFADSWRSPADVGVVKEVRGDTLEVQFPEASCVYSCYALEMELALEWEDITRQCKAKLQGEGGVIYVYAPNCDYPILILGERAVKWWCVGGQAPSAQAGANRDWIDYKVQFGSSSEWGAFQIFRLIK